ncbi:MAG: T9SS type A sorting domain-containing protein [Melioribacteraceae bacterium]|nr:T9SS type A sorting domain-containing protein [Melioribacteraceae bacterium]MCF8353133.1 T9SS type A sorting domain-containing protein [Melioribacteraceae bacterium]MCF8396157.1 T9SS type A sorting domain-containing protein [Melioribacteraceae bacterium]MCF8418252.1 T9SS type A sorting domain-containing protein [Melioribacteraceae bacterium]
MKRISTIFLLLFFGVSLLHAQNFYLGDNGTTGCACHGGDQVASWSGTKHAVAQDSLSTILGYSCLQCHNTGWDESVDNYGADEYVSEGADNAYTIDDPTNFNKVKNVQCETCHGPLADSERAFVGFTEHQSQAIIDLSAESCGTCHEGSHHPTYSDWSMSKHAFAKFTTIPGAFEFIASDPNCSACHTAEGFLQFLETTDLEPNVEAPGPDGNDLTCAACHNPHGSEFTAQLRMAPAELCQKCHNPEYNPEDPPVPDGSEVHHSTAYMFEGQGGFEYDGYDYTSSLHNVVISEKCVTCHVAMRDYVGGDPEIPAYTGHTFEPQLEPCAECHADFAVADSTFDYRNTQTLVDSLMTELHTKLDLASSEDSLTDDFYRAKFNYDFVHADGSMGIHNTKYATALLNSSLENFTPTSVEKDEDALPVNYELSQNYPNPFNPVTNIKFSIPEAGEVSITIYDALGKEVKVLLSKYLDAGSYTTNWNAAGQASGIYFYKMSSDNFVQIRKMLLLK